MALAFQPHHPTLTLRHLSESLIPTRAAGANPSGHGVKGGETPWTSSRADKFMHTYTYSVAIKHLHFTWHRFCVRKPELPNKHRERIYKLQCGNWGPSCFLLPKFTCNESTRHSMLFLLLNLWTNDEQNECTQLWSGRNTEVVGDPIVGNQWPCWNSLIHVKKTKQNKKHFKDCSFSKSDTDLCNSLCFLALCVSLSSYSSCWTGPDLNILYCLWCDIVVFICK